MIIKLSSLLLLCFALSLLSSAEPFTWQITENGISIRVAKGLNPRDPTISEAYHVGDKWGTPSHGPAGRMLGITPLAPLLVSGRDLASLGDPLHIAQRLGQDSSQDSVLARLRGEDLAEDEDAPQFLKNHAQLLALRIAMDQGWQAALPICAELLHSDNRFLARAAQQAVAVLADRPHDQGSPPSLPPLQDAVSSLPSDSFLVVQVDARQAPRWRNPQQSIRQIVLFAEAMKYYAVIGGIIDAAMFGDNMLYTEEQTVLPLILAQRYGNLRVDRTLLALTPSQDMPVGFHLLIEGAFTLAQLTAIAQDADLEIHNGSIDLGFLQADLADGQLRIFTKGTSQGDEGPDWFDTAAAAKTFLYAAAPPEGIQTLSQLIGPLPEQLAGLSDVVVQVQTPGANMQISSNLHFKEPGFAEGIRQMLSILEINQQDPPDDQQVMGISLFASTQFLDFVKPIWDKRDITTDQNLLNIQLTWPEADIADLLHATSTLRPDWQQRLTMGGAILDLQAEAQRIASEHAAADPGTEE